MVRAVIEPAVMPSPAPRRRHRRVLIVVLVGVVLLTVAAAARVLLHHGGTDPDAGEAVAHPRPAGLFYRPPVPLPAAPAGTLIRSQPIPDMPSGTRGWRILYHSRNLAGTDIAVSGFVATPASPPPPTGRHVIAWAHGTTGSSDSCAPSTDLRPVDGVEDGRALLAAGYAIVATDYEGLGTPGPHPYLVGASEARSVLDGMRAAHRLSGAGIGTAFIAFGHSQGGQAVLQAAQIARSYAPELTVLGVAAASPPTNMTALTAGVTRLDFGAAYLLAAAAGYSAAHPTALLSTILTDRGVAAASLNEQICNPQLVDRLTGVTAADLFLHDSRGTEPSPTDSTVSPHDRRVPPEDQPTADRWAEPGGVAADTVVNSARFQATPPTVPRRCQSRRK
ncbi:lipase family protein [Actinoplanes sp. NPDC051411]|uniref:lipase family protein n=1 Tax=Actinoplanes sp. NPDC051411 TaxID=3155522 RepID=UPI0034258BB6